jgi:PD-(D/E)XK nuclease superfamily
VNPSVLIPNVRALLQHSKRVQRFYAANTSGRDGENFNLFNLLNIGHLEVSTHSRILRELLDPNGSHGQGSIFLERFVARLELPPFDFKNARVTTEVGIGAVTDENGGRLDLVIGDGNEKLILIENKIFAGEQENWVSRYHNFAPSAKLVFLTLDGREPEGLEENSRPENLLCKSYRIHISNWLQDCRKEAVAAPLVRESISQYLHLVQELTQQNQTPFMNEDLVKAATDDKESIAAYFALCNVEREVQSEIVRFLQDKLKNIAGKLALSFQGSENCDYSVKASGFEFWNNELDAIPLRIRFEFDRPGYNEFALGFVDDGKLPTGERELLKKLFAETYEKPMSSDAWPAWIYWERYRSWNKVFPEIRFGNFLNDIERELIRLKAMTVKFCEKRRLN